MKVKELLSDESKWCQDCSAKDKDGNDVGSRDVEACKWCLIGAIYKCYYTNTNGISIIETLSDRIYEKLNRSITSWNDAEERTFQDVKDLVEELDI